LVAEVTLAESVLTKVGVLNLHNPHHQLLSFSFQPCPWLKFFSSVIHLQDAAGSHAGPKGIVSKFGSPILPAEVPRRPPPSVMRAFKGFYRLKPDPE
jgi:hypothetical protein